GLGLADGADFGGKLADHLLIAAFDHDVRLVGAGHGQPSGNWQLNFVGIPNAKLQRVLLQRRQVAHADDLQLALVTLGDADNHVLNHRAAQPVQRSGQAAFALAGDQYLFLGFVVARRDLGPQAPGQFAQRTLDRDLAAADADLDA